MIVCRRAEDNPEAAAATLPGNKSICSECAREIIVEDGLDKEPTKLCIYCAAEKHPLTVLFVELPPDEFGRRSVSVGIQEVLAKGDWHKTGVWHDQQWAFSHIE